MSDQKNQEEWWAELVEKFCLFGVFEEANSDKFYEFKQDIIGRLEDEKEKAKSEAKKEIIEGLEKEFEGQISQVEDAINL